MSSVKFQKNTSEICQKLHNLKDFYDVTLFGEDNVKVEAHKLVLASSRRFFRDILKSDNQIHPMIYIRVVSCLALTWLISYTLVKQQ